MRQWWERFWSFVEEFFGGDKYAPPEEQVIIEVMPDPTPIPAPEVKPKFPERILSWAYIIGIAEGARPELHNPGNLKHSTLTASWGATRGRKATDGGWIAAFPTTDMGLDALCNFLVLGCENQLAAFHSPTARTLGGFTRIYAGNPPQGYVDQIVKYLGASETTLISTFLS